MGTSYWSVQALSFAPRHLPTKEQTPELAASLPPHRVQNPENSAGDRTASVSGGPTSSKQVNAENERNGSKKNNFVLGATWTLWARARQREPNHAPRLGVAGQPSRRKRRTTKQEGRMSRKPRRAQTQLCNQTTNPRTCAP